MMAVVGHGIDLVDVVEMSAWIKDSRNPLLSRCFTDKELAAIGEDVDRDERIAGRYAAKEAVLKAIGTGFGNGVSFKDVEILREAGSPPAIRLSGGAEKAAAKLGVRRWQLSISHISSIAMASAIALDD